MTKMKHEETEFDNTESLSPSNFGVDINVGGVLTHIYLLDNGLGWVGFGCVMLGRVGSVGRVASGRVG
jgi:hypothetical protein